MNIVSETRPDVVGLSEVSGHGIEGLDALALDLGYSIIRWDPEGCTRQVALLVSAELVVGASAKMTAFEEESRTRIASDIAMAAVYGPDGRPLTVGVLYNNSPWPTVLSDAHAFAARHTDGHMVLGGDYNMARSLDKDKKLVHLGTAGITRVEETFGWTDVLPGEGGTEVATWPMNTRGTNGSPRQLDHVFAYVSPGLQIQCTVENPVDAMPTPRLSDHALLRVSVERIAPR